MLTYKHKFEIKLALSLGASVIGLIIIFILNGWIKRIENDERQKVLLWAEAIQQRSQWVEYTQNLFEKIKSDERRNAEIWSDAMQRLTKENTQEDLTFLIKIISNNKNIPSILVNKMGVVNSAINLEFPIEVGSPIPDSVRQKFSKYPPIPVMFDSDTISLLYYDDSRLLSELQNVMNDYVRTFMSEVVSNTASVPVIITDQTKKVILGYGNIDSATVKSPKKMQQRLQKMEVDNNVISINNDNNFIFYEESSLLTSLRYYPVLFLLIVIIYVLISYFAFSSSKRYEENQVWVGMSKETAHQLGTPISSLMAWIEILKLQGVSEEITTEIEKDTKRLNTIADRFSKIGSEPNLQSEDIVLTIKNATEYLQKRASKTVTFIKDFPDYEIMIPINKSLFEWVIENLCKNAIDAIESNGIISISIIDTDKIVNVDISDNGRGISRHKLKTIFKPGYTTKQRGWGLGLTLAKRIVEEYHQGKIFVKNSEPNKGTTFRIQLPK